MTTHKIPTTPSRYNEQGHYNSPAIIRGGGPRYSSWSVGGWDATGEGRVVDQGPMVAGPVAWTYQRAAVIDNFGGSAAEIDKAEAEGLVFNVQDGDILEMAGTEYTVKWGRYLTLTKVAAV